MQKPLTISLVIPARNEEGQIANCLRSVLAQQRPFDEIIVVDNGSSDATAAIAAVFPSVKVVSEAAVGIVFARNRGFNAASGDIIARIDADSRLPVDWSEHLAEFYSDPINERSAWTSSGTFNDVAFPTFVSAGYRLVAVHINRWLTGYATLWGSSSALPSSAWQKVRFNTCTELGIHEDLDLTTHLHQAGYQIFWDHSIVVTAQLRHAHSSATNLWEYLQWWPQTLRRHGNKLWPLCWFGGSLFMFGAAWLLTRLPKLRVSQTRATHVPTSLEV